MTHDQNKKTHRQFYCRDYLWEIFEQMSGELECSVDYLVNEAMRQYARSRNYGVGGSSAGVRPPGQAPSAAPPPASGYPGAYGSGQDAQQGAQQGSQAGYPPPPGNAPGFGAAVYPPAATAPAPAAGPSPTHRPPGLAGPPAAPPPAAGYGGAPGGFGGPPPAPGGAPPPLPDAYGGQSSALTNLYVIFNGQKFPVTKEEFIIGRGTKAADLPIKDGNISRRHAAVIWQNGAWYMKDLGSTNGVEFQGRKIDSKRVEEGDIYQLCDYNVRFTYR